MSKRRKLVKHYAYIATGKRVYCGTKLPSATPLWFVGERWVTCPSCLRKLARRRRAGTPASGAVSPK